MRRRLLPLLLFVAGVAPAAPPAAPLRVLIVGNSLTYANDLPAMLSAVAASQPDGAPIATTTFVAPGGTLDERWREGVAAQALRDGHWDALVLQERGGVPACLVDEFERGRADCHASIAAHRAFARLAHERGVRVVIVETWFANEAAQSRLHAGTLQLARRGSAIVVHAGEALQALARRQGSAATFPDGVHPGPAATLVMAAQLHRAITGTPPVAAPVRIDFVPRPVASAPDPQRPLEAQRAPASQVSLLTPDAVRPLFELAARYR